MMTFPEFKKFLVGVIMELTNEFKSGIVDLEETLENFTLSDNPAFSYREGIELRLQNVLKIIETGQYDLLVATGV